MSNFSPYDPVGPVTAVALASHGKPANTVGVSTIVICEDSEGNKFSFSAAYFVNELRPYNPSQERIPQMKIADYMGALVEHRRERKPRLVKEFDVVEVHKHSEGEWQTSNHVEAVDFDALMDEIDAFNLLLREKQAHDVPNIPEFLDKAAANAITKKRTKALD